MMERFTDNARAAVRAAFRTQPSASEQEILLALMWRPRGLAQRLLAGAGVDAVHLPSSSLAVERREVVARAVEEARRRGVPYVGTEHVLLAVARLPGSALASLGATAERLDDLLSVAEAEWRRTHPPLARRLGAACRTALQWLRSRA